MQKTNDGWYYRASPAVKPQADRMVGFDDVSMPPFRFSDAQVHALVAFLTESPKERALRECRPRW